MRFPGFESYLAGVLVSVSALKSEESCGCGEFSDLKPLADWCKDSGLDLVQILPVNDTGDDPSPYSALSAFALHPIYLRPSTLPELTRLPKEYNSLVKKKIDTLKKQSAAFPSLRYGDVLSLKFDIFWDIFSKLKKEILASKNFLEWLKKNPWTREYGAYRTLKKLHGSEGWFNWREEYRFGNKKTIDWVWADEKERERAYFYCWIQYRLEEQLLDACEYLEKSGIVLKGDIPIMMNEDSADVWAQGDNFLLEQRAGAPPDMYSRLGQNWGFPIYNWKHLESTGFEWWKQRLLQADKFYHAYRIDHVLGFFRIWTIPRHQKEGLLGYFYPFNYVKRGDLHSLGFDDGRIRWLSEPHLPGWKLREQFGNRALEIIARCFVRIGAEDLFLFKGEIRGERDIYDLPLSENEKQILLDSYRDRALLQVDQENFVPAWNFRDCERYQALPLPEKQAFEELVAKRGRESEAQWKVQGEKLLGFMSAAVPMLSCAEDLGAVPDCVPEVLKNLKILSLKIPRWARSWNEPGQPYLSLNEYPFLSVCAPSVHDTSTLREWWERENERQGFWEFLGFSGACPDSYDEKLAEILLKKLSDASSALCVFQIQDFFALKSDYRSKDPASERVNVPGTVQGSNWAYRIPKSLENLKADQEFSQKIKNIFTDRKSKKIPKNVP